MKLNILAGGNFAFIASYLFDSVAQNLTLIKRNPSGRNPTWIERSVTNPSVLYAVNEIETGAVQSFTILDTGTLSGALSSISTGGNGPAHVFASSSGVVSAMNYGGGNGIVVRTQNNGASFGDPTFVTFAKVGSSGVSHPHQTIQYKDELFVPDLGGDTIWRLVRDPGGVFSVGGEIKQPTGSGPRHAAIVNDTLVTLHELSSTITSQRIPPLGTNTSEILSSLSIVPEALVAVFGTTFAAAEVLIPTPNAAFPSTLVYASNRNVGKNDDPKGDSIAILSLNEDGKLAMVGQFFTGLKQVRGMQFGGPDERYLVASGVAGDAGVVVFERVDGGIRFMRVASNKEIPNLTSFVWVDASGPPSTVLYG